MLKKLYETIFSFLAILGLSFLVSVLFGVMQGKVFVFIVLLENAYTLVIILLYVSRELHKKAPSLARFLIFAKVVSLILLGFVPWTISKHFGFDFYVTFQICLPLLDFLLEIFKKKFFEYLER